MNPWHVFFLVYFGIYLFIAWKQDTINVFAFFIGYPLLRIPIAATFALIFYSMQDEPLTVGEVFPEQQEVPTLQLSDIMVDDMKEMEAVYILPSE